MENQIAMQEHEDQIRKENYEDGELKEEIN